MLNINTLYVIAIWDIINGDIFSKKWYSNDFVFYVCDMKCLFERFS